MARPLQPYHYAWLSSHPERTKEWLRFMLKAGFDIHHLDGDHSNNAPNNLVLIDHIDHMRLHDLAAPFERPKQAVLRRRKQARLEQGRLAYEAAIEELKSATYASGIWLEAGRKSGVGARAHVRAKEYAEEHNLKWPLLDRRGRKKAA